jgi:hypothetical protein
VAFKYEPDAKTHIKKRQWPLQTKRTWFFFCKNLWALLSRCPVIYEKNIKLFAVRAVLCAFTNNMERDAEQLKLHYAFGVSPAPKIWYN